MSEDFSFMKEKIKDKPFYKKKWVQLVVLTAAAAAVFGVIAGFCFVRTRDWLEEQAAQKARKEIEIPMDTEDEPSQTEETDPAEAVPAEPIVIENELTLEDYAHFYEQLQEVAENVQKSLVTVTAVSSDVDWFNEGYENLGQASGLIIGDNGVELLILTSYSNVKACDGIQVTFVDQAVVTAALKTYDVTTDFAILSVNLSDISGETSEAIQEAVLGNSTRLKAAAPVLAVGRADGTEGSIKVGMLTSTSNTQSVVDAQYRILMTDMVKVQGSDGVLVNLKGEVIGMIQSQQQAAAAENVISAYAISDLKNLISHLSNSQDIAYLGIKAVTVTEEALHSGIPAGIYVTEVELDSPAMLGGVQSGDVLQAVNGQKVSEMSEFMSILTRLSNKQYISMEGRRLTKSGYKKVNYYTSLSVLE